MTVPPVYAPAWQEGRILQIVSSPSCKARKARDTFRPAPCAFLEERAPADASAGARCRFQGEITGPSRRTQSSAAVGRNHSFNGRSAASFPRRRSCWPWQGSGCGWPVSAWPGPRSRCVRSFPPSLRPPRSRGRDRRKDGCSWWRPSEWNIIPFWPYCAAKPTADRSARISLDSENSPEGLLLRVSSIRNTTVYS